MGCFLGRPCTDGVDLDSVDHSAHCTRLLQLFSRWLGHTLPPSSSLPEGCPWLSSPLLLSPSSRSAIV
eukprot:4175983-Pyramimonas_sp.AAC.1